MTQIIEGIQVEEFDLETLKDNTINLIKGFTGCSDRIIHINVQPLKLITYPIEEEVIIHLPDNSQIVLLHEDRVFLYRLLWEETVWELKDYMGMFTEQDVKLMGDILYTSIESQCMVPLDDNMISQHQLMDKLVEIFGYKEDNTYDYRAARKEYQLQAYIQDWQVVHIDYYDGRPSELCED